MMETSTLHNMANAIRFLSADAINQANSGHPGMPLGMLLPVRIWEPILICSTRNAPVPVKM